MELSIHIKMVDIYHRISNYQNNILDSLTLVELGMREWQESSQLTIKGKTRQAEDISLLKGTANGFEIHLLRMHLLCICRVVREKEVTEVRNGSEKWWVSCTVENESLPWIRGTRKLRNKCCWRLLYLL